jgi:hypothetical protein
MSCRGLANSTVRLHDSRESVTFEDGIHPVLNLVQILSFDLRLLGDQFESE